MKTYYNEFDKKKCAALLQLMKDGHITKGEIDDRSIRDVKPEDVRGYDRCHFFAGIGLWDYALQLAEWGDAPVWTGSCPCQPFSSAGRQKGKTDDRHLWPEWFRLIKECRPATVYGEQVASAIAHGWLDDVYQGLESQGYAVGSVVLPACSVGAPHRRDRLWFMANAESERGSGASGSGSETSWRSTSRDGLQLGRASDERSIVADSDYTGQRLLQKRQQEDQKTSRSCEGSIGVMADASNFQYSDRNCEHIREQRLYEKNRYCDGVEGSSKRENERGEGVPLANTISEGSQGHTGNGEDLDRQRWVDQKSAGSTWSSGVWIDCPDGKQRLVEPRIPLLAHGYPERVGVIHCAGDAIVAQVAAEFIRATMP